MKNKLVVLILGMLVAVVWMRSSGGEAPLSEGAFLAYEQYGSRIQLTFHAEDGGRFRTAVEITDENGVSETAEMMVGHGELVDGRMRTESGAAFELGSFGPLWVSPGQLEEGGNAHGSRIDEVRSWNGRQVAVVSASIGMGAALRGEWYYDPATGFLVGGMMATAVSGPDGGQRYQLVDSNIAGLVSR